MRILARTWGECKKSRLTLAFPFAFIISLDVGVFFGWAVRTPYGFDWGAGYLFGALVFFLALDIGFLSNYPEDFRRKEKESKRKEYERDNPLRTYNVSISPMEFTVKARDEDGVRDRIRRKGIPDDCVEEISIIKQGASSG